MPIVQSRRSFLTDLGIAGAAGLGAIGSIGLGPTGASLAAEPLETTTIRLSKVPSICLAPQYVVQELLAAEGFKEIHYVPSAVLNQHEQLARGEIDFTMHFSAPAVIALDAGKPIKILAGIHVGCFELFAREGIQHFVDLKGRTVGVHGFDSSEHVFLSVMASYVGLDPAKDISWVISPSIKPRKLFTQGKIDAFLGFPPEPQELRARKIGHVIVNSSVDQPWSQYFCCMALASTEFVRKCPVATKRALRAFLKATDLCASDPARVAQMMVDGGFTDRFDYALQTLNDIPYGVWREYDPEDTVRFYALRLQELGMIKSVPQEIIANGTDWSFLNDVRRELKA